MATLAEQTFINAGLRLNEHIEEDGPTVFAHACKLGLEGIVSKRKDFTLSFRPLAALDQKQEPKRARGKAGIRRGLAPVTRPGQFANQKESSGLRRRSRPRIRVGGYESVCQAVAPCPANTARDVRACRGGPGAA
jgi:hypothetical protein